MTKKTENVDQKVAALPSIRDVDVERICEFLAELSGATRPPRLQAQWLALIIELDKRNLPYPERPVVAAYLGKTKDSIDSSKGASLAARLITEEVGHVPGSIKQRENVRRLTYYKPTRRLMLGIMRPPAAHGRLRARMA